MVSEVWSTKANKNRSLQELPYCFVTMTIVEKRKPHQKCHRAIAKWKISWLGSAWYQYVYVGVDFPTPPICICEYGAAMCTEIATNPVLRTTSFHSLPRTKKLFSKPQTSRFTRRFRLVENGAPTRHRSIPYCLLEIMQRNELKKKRFKTNTWWNVLFGKSVKNCCDIYRYWAAFKQPRELFLASAISLLVKTQE